MLNRAGSIWYWYAGGDAEIRIWRGNRGGMGGWYYPGPWRTPTSASLGRIGRLVVKLSETYGVKPSERGLGWELVVLPHSMRARANDER